jgi:hypothetical protein
MSCRAATSTGRRLDALTDPRAPDEGRPTSSARPCTPNVDVACGPANRRVRGPVDVVALCGVDPAVWDNGGRAKARAGSGCGSHLRRRLSPCRERADDRGNRSRTAGSAVGTADGRDRCASRDGLRRDRCAIPRANTTRDGRGDRGARTGQRHGPRGTPHAVGVGNGRDHGRDRPLRAPETVAFRLLRGPVPHVVERFTLDDDTGSTRLTYEGELGTDFWQLGRWWGDQVARTWVATVRGSLTRIRDEAERRAAANLRHREQR